MAKRTTKEREHFALLYTIIAMALIVTLWIVVFLPLQRKAIVARDRSADDSRTAEEKVTQQVQTVIQEPTDVSSADEIINQYSSAQ